MLKALPGPAEDEAVITWGQSGDSIFNKDAVHYGALMINPPDDDDKTETKRTYDVVRIENPDDSDQFIETEVMTAFEARTKIDPTRTQIAPDRIKLRFGPTQPSANVTIKQSGLTRSSSGN
jgi:hypothetical protein